MSGASLRPHFRWAAESGIKYFSEFSMDGEFSEDGGRLTTLQAVPEYVLPIKNILLKSLNIPNFDFVSDAFI